MTPAAILFALVARQFAPPNLPVDTRCAIVEAVLASRAKQGRNLDDKPNVVELSFPEIDFVHRSARWASNRTVVTARWSVGREVIDVFTKTESCGSDAFVLEHEVPSGTKGHDGDPTGASDHVVAIILKASPSKKPNQFTFKEGLDLSLHSQPTKCCYGIPAMKYTGTVDRSPDDEWNAKVRRAVFAF